MFFRKSESKYIFILVSAAFFWGTTFVVVQESIKTLPVFFFSASRFIVALLIVFPFAIGKWQELKKNFIPGLIVGFWLFSAYAFQTYGLKFTSASNSAFITGLNFVFTPLVGILLFKLKVKRRTFYGIILALAGFFLLSFNLEMKFNTGDILTLLCALSVAFQILFLDRFLKKGSSEFSMIFYQIFWVALFSSVFSFFTETPSFTALKEPYIIFSVLFTGIFCSAYGFYAQTVGQKHIPPARVALIFIAEPFFGSILDYIINGIPALIRVFGGILIILGLVVGETAPKTEKEIS